VPQRKTHSNSALESAKEVPGAIPPSLPINMGPLGVGDADISFLLHVYGMKQN
jgi:hypothetical protein